MSETREVQIKRLKMRSMRRGIKEMDLILGGFSANGLDAFSDAELGLYDVMLEENDHDLYAWASGAADVPARYADLMSCIMRQTKAVSK